MADAITGGCRCGAVRYALAMDTLPRTYACHCLHCQTWTGSAFSQQAVVPEEALAVTGTVAIYEKQTEDRLSRQRACPVCFTRIYNTNTGRPGMAVVRAGTLDRSNELECVAHIWVKRKQPWVVIPEGVPQWEEYAPPAEMVAALTGAWRTGRSVKRTPSPACTFASNGEAAMSIAQKALWIIERNSSQDLTLNGIADACGVSRSHLAHAFGAATGQSAMRYLRGRRLSEAAQALAAGAPDILTVALDAGYGSHEAFTRAFRDQFAVAPESVRERRSVHDIALVTPIELSRAPLPRPAPPELTRSDKVLVVGLAEPMTIETTHRIPAQWQRFVPYMDAIPHKAPCMPVGVVNALDDAGVYEYICALEVTRFGDAPPELKQLTIAPQTYAVFQHRGHVAAINDTYLSVWNDVLPEMGLTVLDAPSIERHNREFDPDTGEGGLELWIPVAA